VRDWVIFIPMSKFLLIFPEINIRIFEILRRISF